MATFTLKSFNRITYYSFEEIDKLGFVSHAFSTRGHGVSPFPHSALNLSYIKTDARKNVDLNRRDFLKGLNWNGTSLVTLRQLHSDKIHILENRNNPRLEGDGLITAEPNILLGIQVADCYPIILVDPVHHVVSNLHAGWRGTLSRICVKAAELLITRFKSSPPDLIAAIGPGIGACCYEVGEEVIEKFHSEFKYAARLMDRSRENANPHLNLLEANKRQLLDSGLKADRILTANMCTACRNDLFFSHRREKGNAGRNMAVVGIKPGGD